MFIPEGLTEKDVLMLIDQVVNSLAANFRFGYFDIDDMKQQGRLFAIEALPRFNTSRNHTLDNFLYTHVRNRFINYKRDNYFRNDIPCKECPFYDPKNLKSPENNQCSAFRDKMECSKWKQWLTKNEAKKQLAHCGVPCEPVLNRNDMIADIECTELERLIDERLPLDLRADYLKIIRNLSVPKASKNRVRAAVAKILPEIADQYGYDILESLYEDEDDDDR